MTTTQGHVASAKDIGTTVKIMMHDDETVTTVEIVAFDRWYTDTTSGYQVKIPGAEIPFWIPVYYVSPALNPS